MLLAIRLIFSLTLIIVLAGCAAFEENTGPKLIAGPVERIFNGSFDDVWRAVNRAMQSPTSYPLHTSVQETGIIETEQIRGTLVWEAPHKTSPPSAGYSYKISVQVIKGNVGEKSAFKVSIHKKAQIQRDFFSQAEPVASDGLEEKVILYRIERELDIDRALVRSQKRKKKAS